MTLTLTTMSPMTNFNCYVTYDPNFNYYVTYD